MAFNPDMGINQVPRRRSLFGPRELASLAGGFSAPSSGGFWGGLSAGLSGSLGGASRFDVQTHEDEKDQLRRMMEERRVMLDEQRYGLEARRVASSEASDAETNRHNLAMEQRQPSENLPELLRISDAQWPTYAGRYRQLHPEPVSADEAPSMDDATLDMAAQMYLKSGMLPPFGMGKQGATYRAEILKRAAHGLTSTNGPDIAGNKASYDADRKSLSVLTQNKTSVEAFSKTALKNADMLEKRLDTIPDTGTMWGNRAARYIASHSGSADMAAYRAALETVTPELTRILSTATAGGVAITNSQKADVQAALSKDYTKKQMKSALALFRAELANRSASYDEEIGMLKGRLKQIPGGANIPPSSGDVEWVRDASGKLVRKTP